MQKRLVFHCVVVVVVSVAEVVGWVIAVDAGAQPAEAPSCHPVGAELDLGAEPDSGADLEVAEEAESSLTLSTGRRTKWRRSPTRRPDHPNSQESPLITV